MSSFAFSSTSFSETIEQIFLNANQLCFEKKYEDCISKLETLIQAGVHDPDVYFNLGNAYAHSNQCGKALVYFERASILRSREDIAQGMKYCKTVLTKRHFSDFKNLQLNPTWIESITSTLPKKLFSWMFIVSNAMFFAILLLNRISKRRQLKKILSILKPLSACVLIVSTSVLLAALLIKQETPVARVVFDRTSLLSAPNSGTSQDSFFYEGERVYVDEAYNAFFKVHSSDGRHGWVNSSHILKIHR